MFGYLRIFSIISFLTIFAASVLVGLYLRDIAKNDIHRLVEKSNAVISQSFINNVWKRHRINMQRLQTIEPSEWKNYPQFIEFAQDVSRFFKNLPVSKVNIYSSGGFPMTSTGLFYGDLGQVVIPGPLGRESGEDGKLLLPKIAQGNAFSNVLDNFPLSKRAPDQLGSVMHTIVPLMGEGENPNDPPVLDAIMDIYINITEQASRPLMFQAIGTGGILIIFITLMTILIITSRKAEAIITKQYEANLELATAAAAAQAESHDKSQFLANISHELRTPLNAIIGFSDILKTEVLNENASPTHQGYISDINSAGVHLLSLINDILDYSKAEAGKLELEISETNATKLVLSCLRLVAQRADSAQVKLVDSLPKEPFVLSTDQKKFKQVLLNLLSNAIKFTPPGGQVSVSGWRNIADDSFTFEVKDTGIGISPKNISKAMAAFGQIDSSLSRKYDGTGLGLPLTKKFVEVMGGRFMIESEINVGTTITVTLAREFKDTGEVPVKKALEG